MKLWVMIVLLLMPSVSAMARTQTFSASASFSSSIIDSSSPVKPKDRAITRTDKETHETVIIVE